MSIEKVVLDCGHGGSDPGAEGPTGLTEAAAVLQIGKYVRRGLLDREIEVLCIRSKDEFVSLPARCDMSNDWRPDLFLSIHANAFSNPLAHGYEVWTSVGQTAADPIAERIFQSIGVGFPNLAPRFDKSDGDSDKEAGFAVLAGTRDPAVLVECAFISNALEERWLRDVGWLMRMAGSIVSAV